MSISFNTKWIRYVLPAQVTTEGLRTVIPLYVIFLGGDISEVSLVTAFHYGAAAIGSLFWGRVIDRFHVRKSVLIISFGFVIISCIWLYFTDDLLRILIISPIIGFFLVGKNPVTHLLVMESSPKNQWGWLFARTSIVATFGMLTAMIIGTIWSVYFDLRPYFLICAFSTGIALIFSTTIKESRVHLERSSIAHSIHGLRYSFTHLHLVFPRILELYDFKHIISIFKGKVSHEIGILFLATFLFYFGSNIYFTAYTPFLKYFDFSDSTVFLIYAIQTSIMIASFFVAPKLIAKLGEDKAVLIGYIPRIAAVLIAGLVIPIMFGTGIFVVSIISVGLMVIAFSIFSIASSVIFYKSIPQGFEGKYLGVNSSITGIGVFVGAIITGGLTSFLGYTNLFLISSSILVLSLLLFRQYLKLRMSNTLV